MRKKGFINYKVVKTRKPHPCGVCTDIVEKGSLALNEVVYDPQIGYDSTYFHTTEKCVVNFFNIVQLNGEEINRILSKIPAFEYDKLPSHIASMIKQSSRTINSKSRRIGE